MSTHKFLYEVIALDNIMLAKWFNQQWGGWNACKRDDSSVYGLAFWTDNILNKCAIM